MNEINKFFEAHKQFRYDMNKILHYSTLQKQYDKIYETEENNRRVYIYYNRYSEVLLKISILFNYYHKLGEDLEVFSIFSTDELLKEKITNLQSVKDMVRWMTSARFYAAQKKIVDTLRYR